MAKAASPVRLERDLKDAAAVAGSTLHRSAAEQIEYWADIGRKVSRVIDPDTLLEVQAGLAVINVQPHTADPVDVDAVFATLDGNRDSGALSEAVSSASVRYQASVEHPGMLEQVHPDGGRVVGQFENGEFKPQ